PKPPSAPPPLAASPAAEPPQPRAKPPPPPPPHEPVWWTLTRNWGAVEKSSALNIASTPTDRGGTCRVGTTHATSASLPWELSCTCTSTPVESTANRIFSPDCSTGAVEQKKPPQAAAGRGASRRQAMTSIGLSFMGKPLEQSGGQLRSERNRVLTGCATGREPKDRTNLSDSSPAARAYCAGKLALLASNPRATESASFL